MALAGWQKALALAWMQAVTFTLTLALAGWQKALALALAWMQAVTFTLTLAQAVTLTTKQTELASAHQAAR